MPRKPRIEFEGAFYHVITRGNQRQRIFREPADYQKYLQLLVSYKNRYRFSLYAYILMSNHVHLLIEAGETPLSKVLQGLNQSYTMHFNKKYKTVGHLFQGRYKAILCDRDNYLLSLLKYIHHNPIRAKIAERLDAYTWSSHRAYIGKDNPYGLVDTDRVLRMFSESKSRAMKGYRSFMNDGTAVPKEEVYAAIDQRIQGDEDFVDRIAGKYGGEVKKERKKKEYSLLELGRAIEQHYGVGLAQLRSSNKDQRTMLGRRAFSLAARQYGYKGVEIAVYLKKEPSSVTKYGRGEDMRSDVEGLIKQMRQKGKNGNFQV